MRLSRSSSTWRAVVGLVCPKRLAEGAAMGTPLARNSARATACAGTRTATVCKPAVTLLGMALWLGRTRVSGPGQKVRARASAWGGK